MRLWPFRRQPDVYLRSVEERTYTQEEFEKRFSDFDPNNDMVASIIRINPAWIRRDALGYLAGLANYAQTLPSGAYLITFAYDDSINF